MIQILIIISIVYIITWLSLTYERIYKYKQDKLYKLLDIIKNNKADELINELDDIYDEMIKKELNSEVKLWDNGVNKKNGVENKII